MTATDVLPGTRAATAPTGLAFDPAVPARELLLDPAAVAARLPIGGALDRVVEGAELVRVKYRLGESLRVVYRVRLGAGTTGLVVGRTFGPGDVARALARARASTADVGDLAGVWRDEDAGAIWWTFPNDRKLRGLDAILTPDPDVARLAERAGTWTASELVGLAPERSAVFRASNQAGRTIAYAKVYAPGTARVGELAALYDGVAAHLAAAPGNLAAPTCLGLSAERNLLLLAAMPGQSWVGQEPAEVRATLRRLGACIAVLHGAPPPPGAGLSHFGRLDAARVAHAAALVAQARPDVAELALGLAARLAATRPAPEPDVLLHGDCHPGNLLSTPGGVTLIDLDQAGLGSAALDIASLLGRLRQGELTGEFDAATTRALGEAFCAGYASVRPLPSRASLAWHLAAALLVERALRAVNRVHRPMLARLANLLDGATTLTEGDLP